MQIKPIHTKTKLEMFIDQVEDWIFSGQVQPGDRLPSERTLAQQMQISRSVVNNGLNHLAQLKLIQILPQSGSIVNDYAKNGNLVTLNELLKYTKGHYQPALLKSIYAARQLFEGEIVRQCAQTITRTEVALLRNLIDDFATAKEQDSGEFLYRFFHQLAIDSHNQVYPLLISSFHQVYVTLGEWNSEQHGKEKIIQLNTKLINCLAHHQVATASQVHDAIIKWSLSNLLRSS